MSAMGYLATPSFIFIDEGASVTFSRRDFLKLSSLGAIGALTTSPFSRALAAAKTSDEFFIFIHAAGGWDVTLWADPRNERRGLIEPASTENTDTAGLRHWVDAPLGGGASSFALVHAPGSERVFGPGIGNLLRHHDRFCVINGLSMNTVSHPDGVAFSATGRHLQGSRVSQSSVNTILAHELGVSQILPSVSINFPSAFAGAELDRRAVPLSVGSVGTISRSLARSKLYDDEFDRRKVTALLASESQQLAAQSTYPEVLDGMALQFGGLDRMLNGDMQELFNEGKLKKAHPELNYKTKFHGAGAVSAAFALEAIKRNVLRCFSFALGGFDTHANNYKYQAMVQQDLFDLVAAILEQLDITPHPTKTASKLSEHAHILVISDFCRTPAINIAGGRDHYPNNSALVISPRFRGGLTFGKSDPDQLLPVEAKQFLDGRRAIAPPDLLATFLSAFAVDPRRYLRDGEVVPELLLHS